MQASVVSDKLSCPTAHGIFPDQETCVPFFGREMNDVTQDGHWTTRGVWGVGLTIKFQHGGIFGVKELSVS